MNEEQARELRSIVANGIEFKKLGSPEGDMFIELAEEMISKGTFKKAVRSKSEMRYVPVYECPTCGQRITSNISNYCYNCGQKLFYI